ncbi:shikimate kinase [Flavobacterium branchiophilum]|uniref:Shikimate kinase n=1 Tax=Flavobacterium branchiophilum TaxID=55197 RepID=A0A543G000_9FLAO|nr:shikimate kinase [Flavobacterium branchiophilum]OXA74516.1 shikimate kinase [Flavobacterium branchiophilum] [Flavobacterium branchiophilum NBRC 15030 = ATCC 35035]TQM39416.1 shikimate kinase [Flavobacterium branchiophilum]GEM55488.1 shikimate kinase [Flavobacterium branchiophilum NBRC 15030 = ATCC 35035]
MKKIVLVGYMGSGKSHIGQLLSKMLHLHYLDLDDVIENHENKSIKNIFETQGEIYFRKIEHQILNELMQNANDMVLSLGGGTPCYYDNYHWLENPKIQSIYLEASVATLFERLQTQKAKRPILAPLSDEEMSSFIAKHLFERNEFYRKSQHIVSVNQKTPEQIVQEILLLLA